MATATTAVRLEDVFRGLHRRLRSIAVWSGTLWCVAAALLLLLLIGLIDWRWHVDLPHHRQTLLAIAALLWGALLAWLVIRPARRRYQARETAQRIEAL
ncbi:MAG: hypothetical protein JNG89_10275, partial [Planctomycetaceae bacterium]|nr:hypothetical protein [Planctomycetaceae bacterium]